MMWWLFFKLFFKRNFGNDHVMVHRLLVSGSSPTHQQADIRFEIPRTLQTAMPGASPIHQQVNTRWQNQSPATTNDRIWLCTPVDHHQPWDSQDSKLLPLNPGLPVSRCHLHIRQGLATNLTGSQPLLSDQPLSLPNTTGPMWPHRQHPENTQLWSPEERALLRCTGCSHNRSLLQGQETSSTWRTHRNKNSKSGKRNRGIWSQRRKKKNPQKVKMKQR